MLKFIAKIIIGFREMFDCDHAYRRTQEQCARLNAELDKQRKDEIEAAKREGRKPNPKIGHPRYTVQW